MATIVFVERISGPLKATIREGKCDDFICRLNSATQIGHRIARWGIVRYRNVVRAETEKPATEVETACTTAGSKLKPMPLGTRPESEPKMDTVDKEISSISLRVVM